MPLTLKQVMDGLRGLGVDKVKNDDPDNITVLCPVCKKASLHITDTPTGAALTCENDAPETIAGALQYGLGRLRRQTEDPLQYVREIFEEPDLQAITKHGKTGESYTFTFTDGAVVELGGITTLITQTKFRAAYLPQRRRLPTRGPLKGGQWDQLVEAIERAADERDTVSTDNEEALGWLRGYTRQTSNPALDTTDPETLYEHLGPEASTFTDQDGRLHIRLTDFTAWVNHVGGGRTTSRELSTRLSGLGFDRHQLAARRPPHLKGPDTRKIRYYASTPGLDLDT